MINSLNKKQKICLFVALLVILYWILMIFVIFVMHIMDYERTLMFHNVNNWGLYNWEWYLSLYETVSILIISLIGIRYLKSI